MKSLIKILVMVFLSLDLMSIISCKDEESVEPVLTAPVLTTVGITGITQISAVSGGNITDDGGAAVTARGVCYGTSPSPTISGSKTTDGSGTGTFASTITGLMVNTQYFVRAYATNSKGTSYGNEVSFTTNPVVLPTLTTTLVSAITSISAVSGGTITNDGGGAVTARGVCWATTQNPTIINNKTTDGSGTGNYTSNLTNLSPGTTYYVRAYAVNSAGTAYGNELSFATTGVLATITDIISISHISQSSAQLLGEIQSDGGSDVTARGFCYSTSQNPTIADSKTNAGTGTGAFESVLSALQANTTYYVRAFATNSAGTAYSSQVDFHTLVGGPVIFNSGLTYSTVTDVEGNVYKTIQIGTQVWMAENLRTTKFNDNTSIPLVTDNTAWSNLTSPGYSSYNNDAPTYKATYGLMYNWYVVETNKVCPVGWHVALYGDWDNMMIALGVNEAANKLKEAGNTHWESPNDGTNETGFSAIPGGERTKDGKFISLGERGQWWTSNVSSYPLQTSYGMSIFLNNQMIQEFYFNSGMPIRCIKD